MYAIIIIPKRIYDVVQEHRNGSAEMYMRLTD